MHLGIRKEGVKSTGVEGIKCVEKKNKCSHLLVLRV